MKRLLIANGICLAAVALTFAVTEAKADIILGQHDWDLGAENWSSMYGWTTLQDPAEGGWLSISFDTTTIDPEELQNEWFDVVRVQAKDLFAGTWTPDMFVQFNFWSENVAPDAIEVQWSSSTNSQVWAYSITPSSSLQQWTTYQAPFGNLTDWLFSGATEDQYLADLSSIDWIGLYIHRTGAAQQIYGIDNFKLMVPEPAETTVLCVALTVALIALRRRHLLQFS